MNTSLVTRIGAGVAALVLAQLFLSLALGAGAMRMSSGPPRLALVEQGMALARIAVTPSGPAGVDERLEALRAIDGFALARYDETGALMHVTRADVTVEPRLSSETMRRTRELQGRALLVRGRTPIEPTVAFASLPPHGDAVFIGLYESNLPRRLARSIGAAFVGVGVALATMTVMVTWWLTSRARAKLADVERVVSSVAAGELSSRLTVRGRDEFARVAEGFNAMADRLERTIDDLRLAEAQRRRMLAAVSHELRTPLTSVLGYLESLCLPEVDADGPTRRRYAEVAFTQARALAALTEDLAVLSRLDLDDLVLQHIACDLEAIVRAQLASFEPRCAPRGVTLRATTPGCVPMRADPARLGQVLRNLLDNAVRHAPDGTSVQVSLEASDETVCIEVSDDGPGVPDADLRRLGEPLLRLDDSRSRASGGRGLGLSIAAGIVRAHGGLLTFESVPERGLVARVVLPRPATVTTPAVNA